MKNMKRILLLMLLFTSFLTMVGCDATSMSQFSSALTEQNGQCTTYNVNVQTWHENQWKDGMWTAGDLDDVSYRNVSNWCDSKGNTYKYYKVGIYQEECPHNDWTYRFVVTCY